MGTPQLADGDTRKDLARTSPVGTWATTVQRAPELCAPANVRDADGRMTATGEARAGTPASAGEKAPDASLPSRRGQGTGPTGWPWVRPGRAHRRQTGPRSHSERLEEG